MGFCGTVGGSQRAADKAGALEIDGTGQKLVKCSIAHLGSAGVRRIPMWLLRITSLTHPSVLPFIARTPPLVCWLSRVWYHRRLVENPVLTYLSTNCLLTTYLTTAYLSAWGMQPVQGFTADNRNAVPVWENRPSYRCSLWNIDKNVLKYILFLP